MRVAWSLRPRRKPLCMEDPRIHFVVNPRSAGGRTGRTWTARERVILQAFPQAKVHFTTAPKHAIQLAADVQAKGHSVVVAVGGDGTVHEVVNGLMARGAAELAAGQPGRAVLGVLPSGTGCDFARGLGIGPSFEQALAQLRAGRRRTIDLGRVHKPADAGRSEWFNNVASFGVTGEIVERIQRSRKWFGTNPTYLWAAVCALLRYRNARVKISMNDGEALELRMKAVAIGNANYFGGGMCIAPDARVDSGQLQAAIFGDLGRIEAVRRLGETYAGKRIDHPRISYHDCRSLMAEPIGTRSIGVELDGEAWGHLPARFEIVPAALQVIVP
jgi:YegS/Rv2252/BmrU family lipid kinase